MVRPRHALALALAFALALTGLSADEAVAAKETGSRLAFTDEARRLTVVDVTGRRQVIRTAEAVQSFGDVTWSPNGRKLAYVAADLPGQIRVLDVATGVDRPLVTLPHFVSEPRWSPDGRHIAFESLILLVVVPPFYGDGERHISVIEPDGSGLRVVAGGYATDPEWSPDGKQLAYVTAEGLYVTPVDGLPEARRVTPLGMAASAPAWAPNDRTIAFLGADRLAAVPDALYVVRPDGTRLRKLPSYRVECCWARRPSWSPDSRRIAYVSEIAVNVVSVSSGRNRIVGPAYSSHPSWSPDGTYIAMAEHVDPTRYALILARADGSPRYRRLATVPYLSSQLAWAPR